MDKLINIILACYSKSDLKYNPIDDCIDGAAMIEQYNVHDHKSKHKMMNSLDID